MLLSTYLPTAIEHIWQGQKDEHRSVRRAERLLSVFDPDECDYTPLLAKQALSTWSPATSNRYRASLGSLLRARRMLGFPRLELPPVRKEPRSKDRVMTREEETRMLETPVGPLVSLLLTTGMRLSEVYRARLEGGFLVLDDTKNGNPRKIPLRDAPWPLDLPPERSLRRLWAAHAPGGITPHTCRHTAITRWAEAGLSLPVIKALAGHTSTETTLRYLHVTPQYAAKELDRLL